MSMRTMSPPHLYNSPLPWDPASPIHCCLLSLLMEQDSVSKLREATGISSKPQNGPTNQSPRVRSEMAPKRLPHPESGEEPLRRELRGHCGVKGLSHPVLGQG